MAHVCAWLVETFVGVSQVGVVGDQLADWRGSGRFYPVVRFLDGLVEKVRRQALSKVAWKVSCHDEQEQSLARRHRRHDRTPSHPPITSRLSLLTQTEHRHAPPLVAVVSAHGRRRE